MKDKYAIKDLITGNVIIVHSYGECGPVFEVSRIVFIVERVDLKFRNLFSKTKKYNYNEIFTEFKMILEKDTVKNGFDCKDFDTPYLTNLNDIHKYVNKAEEKSGYISRMRLMEIYNYLNFEAMIKED
jgi:hypothetical protein